ncbi:MAG: hypothetical protein GXO88_08440 [Chlorobi bacterium]|nr:hypothetical protein [Chlorobiota bacterium]
MGNPSSFKKIFSLTLLLTVGLISATADNNPYKKHQDTIEEKVILVCDRDLYLSGEKIIFTARVFVDNEPNTDFSKILYVELFKDGQSVEKAKYKLDKGFVEAVLNIPEDLASGNYYIRAYTMFMRNQVAETFFNTRITIINPERKADSYKGKYSKAVLISENNNIILNKLENSFAVLFNGNFLEKLKTALIIDSKGDSITDVVFFKNGLGRFAFVPRAGHRYFMKANLGSEDTVFIKLDTAANKGLVAGFDVETGKAEILQIGHSTGNPHLVSLYTADYKLIDSDMIDLADTVASLSFGDIDFPSGLNYLVVSTKLGETEGVFPFYVGSQKLVGSKITFEGHVFGKREKVEFALSGIDEKDEVIVNVSKKNPLTEEEGFLPKEFIFNPLLLNYDFDPSSLSDEKAEQIRLGVLLNADMFNSAEFKKNFSAKPEGILRLPEVRDLSISGKIINAKTGEGIADQNVYASVLGGNPQLHTNKTDASGNFIFSLNQLQGIQDVGLSIDSIDNVNPEIIVNNDFSTSFPLFADFPVQIDSNSGNYIVNMFRNKQLASGFKQLAKIINTVYDSIPFPFQEPQTSVNLADYVELPSLREVFDEIVTYVSVRRQKGHYSFHVLNGRNETLYKTPLILLDKLAVFDVDELLKINPAQLSRIEVVTNPYTLGDMRFDGIIMIETKEGGFGGMKLSGKTVFLKYTTTSPGSHLVYPDFESDALIKKGQAFFANTIYHESRLLGTGGDTDFSFFTSDEKGMFEIKVDIIRADGTHEVLKKTIEIY